MDNLTSVSIAQSQKTTSLDIIKNLLEKMDFSRIIGKDNIYIGGIRCLKKEFLQKAAVTHIVSVMKYDFKRYEHLQEFKHLQIEVDDIETENLLEIFEKTGAWIKEALKNGDEGKPGVVLVHCAMGISRSVTIVLAYLLRENVTLEVSDALSLVQRARPKAHPNDGFIAQLKLYKEMECPKNIETHPKYLSWIYQQQIKKVCDTGMPPSNVRFLDEDRCSENQNEEEGEFELRCRKCRNIVATSPYLIQHVPKATPVTQKKLQTQMDDNHKLCTSHFIHPLSWMRPILEKGLLSGRLECPNKKCASLIGRYSWQGQRCSCITWVCPSFSLQKSRCDKVYSLRRPSFPG
ncbi:Tyrosine-protein phosphatase yvh1 [Erysiphe neolycopersici]|uniref:protein-tyrosine-phosphatase n=1 Tax=Erysiphe neolycopersici TaxID=212602 RepID=A0A420I5G6_9PEZI|nr:Tyrosine-protein phosphatase yvh1 [Erysiphe neolycopersici]